MTLKMRLAMALVIFSLQINYEYDFDGEDCYPSNITRSPEFADGLLYMQYRDDQYQEM